MIVRAYTDYLLQFFTVFRLGEISNYFKLIWIGSNSFNGQNEAEKLDFPTEKIRFVQT